MVNCLPLSSIPSQLDVLSAELRDSDRHMRLTVASLGIFRCWLKSGAISLYILMRPRGCSGSCFPRQLPCTFPPRRKTSCVRRQRQDDSTPGMDSGTVWPIGLASQLAHIDWPMKRGQREADKTGKNNTSFSSQGVWQFGRADSVN